MKKLHPFFTIGTAGIVAIALLHLFLALGLSITTVHSTFLVLYPVFIAFLMIGIGLTMKKQKETNKA